MKSIIHQVLNTLNEKTQITIIGRIKNVLLNALLNLVYTKFELISAKTSPLDLSFLTIPIKLIFRVRVMKRCRENLCHWFIVSQTYADLIRKQICIGKFSQFIGQCFSHNYWKHILFSETIASQAQWATTCSKSTIKTLEVWNKFNVNNSNTRTTSLDVALVSLLFSVNLFHTLF